MRALKQAVSGGVLKAVTRPQMDQSSKNDPAELNQQIVAYQGNALLHLAISTIRLAFLVITFNPLGMCRRRALFSGRPDGAR